MRSPDADPVEALMQLALEQARQAGAAGEVPVGAVVVRQGQVVAVGHNQCISQQDPSAHAEVQALRAAARVLGNYRLSDCELITTLEPCAMCAGAMLHARIARLVYGAADPVAGAAGSVLNLFAQPRLNHHTQVRAGVLAAPCAQALTDFFEHRRRHARTGVIRLREDALRTPAHCFESLEPMPRPGDLLGDLPGLDGLQMHCLDAAPESPPQAGAAALSFLCLHGSLGWGYQYRHMLPALLAAGHRVVVPDLIGFGRSDKPKREAFHTLATHLKLLQALVQRLNLQQVVLVLPSAMHHLGLCLPMTDPARYKGIALLSSGAGAVTASAEEGLWMPQSLAAHPLPLVRALRALAQQQPGLAAPFPDTGHAAALRASPLRVNAASDAASLALWHRAQAFLQHKHNWNGKSLVLPSPQSNWGSPFPTGISCGVWAEISREILEPSALQAQAAMGYFGS